MEPHQVAQEAANTASWGFLGIGPHNIGVVLLLCVLVPVIVYKFYNSVSPFHTFPSRSTRRPKCTDAWYHYGVEEIQGKRAYMEDRHVVAGKIGGDPQVCLYGVFDGHGGARAAEFCVENLVHNVTTHPELITSPRKALRDGFLATDQQFLEVARAHRLDDGTTACVALVIGQRLFVANAGDSRAVLVQRRGRVEALSIDHKPHRVDEKMRIKRQGGNVYLVGVWRVQGILAVSRAIGDRKLKRYVSAEPEVTERRVTSQDRFVVIASDGLWDVMSNEEVGDMVHLMRSAQEAASLLVECAYSRGSADNITVMIIDVLRAQQAVVQGRPRGVGGNGLVGGGSGGNGGGGGIGGDGTGANGGLDDDSNGDPGGVLGDLHGAGAGLGAGSAVMVDDHYASSGREHEL